MADLEGKERFYSSLEELVTQAPKENKLVILDDFNARVEKDSGTWNGFLGNNGAGNAKETGHILLTKCWRQSCSHKDTLQTKELSQNHMVPSALRSLAFDRLHHNQVKGQDGFQVH